VRIRTGQKSYPVPHYGPAWFSWVQFFHYRLQDFQ
jgi:hypothetical protein